MTLTEKVNAVEAVLHELDAEISKFQSATTLHCKMGCGKCCFKADIEASVLEFLPFAKHLHKEGRAEEWLAMLEHRESPLCVILDPRQAGVGLCSEYQHRGLICRLFGYSARTNKYEKKELVTCEIIKTEQTIAYTAAQHQIEEGAEVPVMNQFYMQLLSIDPDLGREFFPINEAIKRAIETVLQYYAYRDDQEL